MVQAVEVERETTLDRVGDDAYAVMVGRLNRLSVDKHFDAYVDIEWDAPEMVLEAADARLRLHPVDPLARSEWYGSLTSTKAAEVGLYRYAACMKIGWHFENLLQRGLLLSAFELDNGDPAFRYLHHEIIEESQHTLMFQEFVNRSKLPVRGMARSWRLVARQIVNHLPRVAPSLFFFIVLGGEDPVDHLQRSMLRVGIDHPLVERIMRIHVTEEARHLSFARHTIKRDVPRLGPVRRLLLSVAVPIVMGIMARMMLRPPSDMRRHTAMPRSTLRRAFASEEGRQLLRDSVSKTRRLSGEVGLLGAPGRWVWKLCGIWDDAA